MMNIEQDTFPKLLLRNAQKWPNLVAMRKKHFGIWKEYTWEDCFHSVKNFSLGLLQLGFQRGDKLAIIGEREPEWFWAELAAQAAGATVVALYANTGPAEIRRILKQSPCKFVVAHDQEQVDKFMEIKNEVNDLHQIIYWDSQGLKSYSDECLKSFGEVLELGRNYDAAHNGVFEENVMNGRGDDCAVIYYTLGTAGPPKGAMLTHKSLINSGKAFLESSDTGKHDNCFSYLPTAWAGEGMLVTAAHLLAGTILNFPEDYNTTMEDQREIAPDIIFFESRQLEVLARLIRLKMINAGSLSRSLYRYFMEIGYKRVNWIENDHRPSLIMRVLLAVGNQIVFHPICEDIGLKKCKIAVTTGSPISIDCFRFWTALGIDLRQVYVSTEAGFIAGHQPGKIRSGTVGNIGEATIVKISDQGEILVKSPATFSGYCESSERIPEPLQDGWVHTGDVGFVDTQGQLVQLGLLSVIGHLSKETQLIHGRIEGRLRFSPYVKDAIVLGREDGLLAVIVNIDFESVCRWAEGHKIKYETLADLSQKEEVASLIRGDIQRLNQEISTGKRVKKFAVLHKKFNGEEGELTCTGLLKRQFIEERYADLVSAFQGKARKVEMEVLAKYSEGTDAVAKTSIRIWLVDKDEL